MLTRRKKLEIRVRASTRTLKEVKPPNLAIMMVETLLSQGRSKKMMKKMTRKTKIRSQSLSKIKNKQLLMTMMMSFAASVGMVPMRSITHCYLFVNAQVVSASSISRASNTGLKQRWASNVFSQAGRSTGVPLDVKFATKSTPTSSKLMGASTPWSISNCQRLITLCWSRWPLKNRHLESFRYSNLTWVCILSDSDVDLTKTFVSMISLFHVTMLRSNLCTINSSWWTI